MPETIRLRTQIGVDRQINVELEQDFEQLEILSLKIRSEEIYTRMCAEYGVVVGRVVANGGYGVPNVKVGIFVPITSEDQTNEIISTLYPYTNITDLNEDGYKFNLLPYEQQHTGHVPVGTFPSRNDVLTNPAVIEIYDKYLKYTAKTNGSGDFMIMGVPIGTHTLVMDLDLSDIGPFSLSPQDLVRMGIATPDQLDGVNFIADKNLYELPQIISLNKNIEVQPFWGQPDICQISIARHDFDLRQNGITIKPTAMFMGSLVTGINDEAISKNCKPPKDMGNLCNLEVGPGEIIGVRQTIYQDTDGRPILEQASLPRGGKVIDEDGTWVMEVPMNLDYVTTNEFGEQILSQDPSVGIPTKGKYRFKVKYSQPSNFESDEVRRGYFLVPNIKEHGWVDSDNDPAYIVDTNDVNYKKYLGSYYFGLDWSGYTNAQDAIACKDTFYELQYNKVYTVSGHYDEYKKGFNRSKFIGIKEITDSSCASENNKYPATDGVQNFDFFVFLVNTILLSISYFTFVTLIPVIHVLAFIWPILQILITFVYGVLLKIVRIICIAISYVTSVKKRDCPEDKSFSDIFDSLKNPFINITLPSLSYPDCQACDCSTSTVPKDSQAANDISNASVQNNSSDNSNFFINTNWNFTENSEQDTFAGVGYSDETTKLPVIKLQNGDLYFVDNLPIWETINKFNLKSKYFDSDVYPGSNRIKVQVEPTLNPSNYHFDNIMMVFVDPNVSLTSGQLLSFQDATLSKDPNPKVIGTGTTTGISGTTVQGGQITVNYANPSNSNSSLSTIYNLNGSTSVTGSTYLFSTDIEYFQVLSAMTYNEFISQDSQDLSQRLLNQIDQQVQLYKDNGFVSPDTYINYYSQWVGGSVKMVFMVRGVDPHSGRKKIKYDLSRIFGYSGYGNKVIEGDFYLNVPIQPNLKNVRHDLFNSNTDNNSGYLYYNSYKFSAGTQYSSYTTNLQSYYSSLDSTQINVFKPNASNANSLLISSMVNVGGDGQLNAIQTTPIGVGYNGNEYIEGGSYVWYGVDGSLGSFGVLNNGVVPTYYYAPSYPLKNMTVYKSKMVMRSDRLPVGTNPEKINNNTYSLMSSNNLPYVRIPDTGTASVTSPSQSAGGGSATAVSDVTTGGTINKVIASFSCEGMVDLGCYEGYGSSFTVLPKTNECNTNSGGEVVVKGCYSLINRPVLTLFGRNNDFSLLAQWLARFRMSFAICRGVVSHTFVNSWLNGSLFAFPFESVVFFDSDNKPFVRKVNILNKVTYTFCADVIMYEPTSNNFYYRSSPWDGTKFVGSRAGTFLSQPVNTKDLLYPTTILDMGPKFIWSKEVSMNPNYYGYQMDKFNSTSWSSDSDLLQLFLVSRLANSNFLQNLLGVGTSSVGQLFSRDEDRVDGDFAQMLQINSQYGIVPFTAENYIDDPTIPGDNPIYVSGDSKKNPVFGIFYSGNTQDRDLISPRRLDRVLTGTTLIADYLGTKSQEVPYFKWANTAWTDGQPSIFGNQYNSWYTYGGNPIVESSKYQELDRRLQPYFRGNNGLLQNATGYVYQRDDNGSYNVTPNGPSNNYTLTSAPWYFYFGLKKGRSAMDKFVQLYIGE